MKHFPTLYKKTSTGAIQTWNVSVDGNVIVADYGQLGGKIQTARDVIREGKNLGKKNATTPEEQAELEAFAQWEKKRKKHYQESIEAVEAGEVDSSVIAGGILPMLAQSYNKHAAKIIFPAAVQPKLDGHRCIAVVKDGEVTLWSRTQKPITGVPHIVEELELLDLPDGTVLDGELYNHDYRDRFEELTSFIKRPEPKPGCEAVEYHVYDTVNQWTFEFRQHFVEYNVEALHLMPVETINVEDESAMWEAFAHFTEQGYEGLIVRNWDSAYVNKRSYDLQKVKEFDDAEFQIVNVVEGRGKLAGKGIFVCATADGDTFQCKMTGPLEDLAEYLEHKERYVGHLLTVQYFGITNASSVPRFPVGLRVREDV